MGTQANGTPIAAVRAAQQLAIQESGPLLHWRQVLVIAIPQVRDINGTVQRDATSKPKDGKPNPHCVSALAERDANESERSTDSKMGDRRSDLA